MSSQWYEVLALLMRYWFALLAVLTVYRALRWMLTDASLRRKAMRALPDAGYIGHLLVLCGESRALSSGDEIQLPCEGTLGYSKRCDVCIRHKSLFAREAFFWLEQDGLHMSPLHAGSFIVDDEQVGAGDEAVLRSGARLFIGEVSLELKLLKGLQLDGAFEQPLEPYVTPERRKRAQRATQRKRTVSKKPAGERRKTGRTPAEETASVGTAASAPSKESPNRRKRNVSKQTAASKKNASQGDISNAKRNSSTASKTRASQARVKERSAKRRLDPPDA